MKLRQSVQSGSPYETTVGFCRAVRVDGRIIVAGTAPIEADGSSTPGGAYQQAARCLRIIVDAITALGGSAADVVRTRMFITDPADADAIGRAHGELFRDIRPAATMVGVPFLLRPEWKVEIEAEAVVRTVT
jgi:enamine deaminase RidA (YjgF/YER057c/UK114 family)